MGISVQEFAVLEQSLCTRNSFGNKKGLENATIYCQLLTVSLKTLKSSFLSIQCSVKCFLFHTACTSAVTLLLWDKEISTNLFACILIFCCLVFSKRSDKSEVMWKVSYVYIFNGKKLLAPCWRATPFRQCVGAY